MKIITAAFISNGRAIYRTALQQNLRGAAGKYVKARVQAVETERLINGSIRKSSAYADHSAVADSLREYLAKRAA